MTTALAASPVLAAIALLLVLRQSAARAGAAGLLAALLVVWLVPRFQIEIPVFGDALLFAGLTTLMVAYVLLGGLVLFHILRAAGALETIARGVSAAIPNPNRRILVLVLGLSVFFESATGFGIGIIVAAPLFVSLGFRPLQAALLALAGQCAVTWGALAVGTTLGAELVDLPADRLGLLAAPMTLPLMLMAGGVGLWFVGGRAALLRSLPELAAYSIGLAAVVGAGSVWVGVEVAGILGGLAVTLAGLVMSRLRDGPAPRPDVTLGRAVLPFALLLIALLATRLVPAVTVWLGDLLVLDVPSVNFRLAPFYHPGFWMISAALLAVPALALDRTAVVGALTAAVRQWVVATLAIAGFLCFSQIMFAAGMTAALAETAAAAAGSYYVFFLPLVGGLGGFLTASNAGSNAMFAQFQATVGGQLGLPPDVVAAAQNAAGANTSLASPGRIVLAAAVTGLAGQEGALMRPALILAGAGLAALAIVLWLWTGPAGGEWL